MFHIFVKLHKLQHVEKLAPLLRPILHRATNFRSLSLPIHMATANLLDNHTFGYIGEDLEIKAASNRLFGLDEITLVRSPVQCDQLYTYHRTI
jgi:hypothetical protein